MTFTKTTLDKRNNAPSGISLSGRTPASRSSFVRIVVYHYVNSNFGPATNIKNSMDDILEVDVFEIDSSIASIDVSKNMNNASADFQVALHPSEDWKERIFPGDWVIIYFFSNIEEFGDRDNEKRNIVLLGNVDRISRNSSRDEVTDKLLLRYQMSGRSFGKVLENTDVWFDPYNKQDSTLDNILQNAGLEIGGSPDTQVNAIMDVFLGGGHTFTGTALTGTTSPLGQWVIPKELGSYFGVLDDVDTGGETTFFNILENRIQEELPGYKTRNQITVGDSGSVWDMIKRSCNSIINEVFLEETRDANGYVSPSITLRPRPLNTPFIEENMGDESSLLDTELNGAYTVFQSFATENFIEISQREIIYEDMGKDDASRFNMFILAIRSEFDYMTNRLTNIDSQSPNIANPMVIRESIRRYGLRRFDQQLEFVQRHVKATGNGADFWIPSYNPEINLFKAFISQLYDMNYVNHMMESGVIECTGVLEAELGKVLVVLPESNEHKKKIYYIEGYQHKWGYPNTWRTTFTLTHGQFLDTSLPFINGTAFDRGSFDKAVDEKFVARSVIKRAVG